MSHVAQVHALAGLVLILVAVIVHLRDQHHDREAYLEAELAAAETDLRAAGGSRRVRWRRPEHRCNGFDYPQTIPTDADLALWAVEVDGLPWGRMTDGQPADVVDDPGSPTPKLALTAPVSTARLRRLVAA